MKKWFTVEIREVHISYREVEAETVQEAVEIAQDVAYETHIEYSHTPDMPVGVFDTETGERITDDARELGC